MRVIAGTLGGRMFKSPSGHSTHPMSDKMRGALFNSLGDISGMRVLDAFAGSGALGLEAISRGAGYVTFVERDRSAQQTIQENCDALRVNGSSKLIQANVASWLKTIKDNFDLILLDPPYDKLQYETLEKLSLRLKPGGRLVLSWPSKHELMKLPGCTLAYHKQYGDGSLYFYDVISL